MKNIFLLTVDSLRYDSFLGMEYLLNLAKKGISFINCYTTATSTPAALTGILTGKTAVEHKKTKFEHVSKAQSIGEIADRSGYETYAIGSASFMTLHEFGNGFKHKINVSNAMDKWDEIENYFDRNGLYNFDNNRLYFVHTMKTHHPYGAEGNWPTIKVNDDTPKEKIRHLENCYHEAVYDLDKKLERFLSRLFGSNDYLFIFCSDHGDTLADGKEYLFAHTGLSEEVVIHVPFFVYASQITWEQQEEGFYYKTIAFDIIKKWIEEETFQIPPENPEIEIDKTKIRLEALGYI